MNDTVIVSSQPTVQARAAVVSKELARLGQGLESGFLDICFLLSEAHAGEYHHVYGFAQFGQWVEQASGLDISARQGMYYVQIAKKSTELGLTREQLKAVKIAKLKEILSLDVEGNEQTIKDLIYEAPALTLKQVQDKVRALKGQSEVAYITLKLDKEVKDTFDEAVELARKNCGSDVVNGEVTEVSTSRCVEFICATFLQDPNNQAEHEVETIPVEVLGDADDQEDAA